MFEISDDEAREIRRILFKQLGKFKYVIEAGKKGMRVMGKETLEQRIIIVEKILDRLTEVYGEYVPKGRKKHVE